MQYTKGALTFEQQLALMMERGMQVADQPRALAILRRISYYRLAGYWYGFRQFGSDNFVPGCAFEEAVTLYEFDRRLRLLILDAVERFEVALRTAMTYEVGHRYGAFGHLNVGNFATGRRVDEHAYWLATVRVEASRTQEMFVKSYEAKYDEFPDLPIWMASEVMSFGTLSKMLARMKNSDQKAVASHFEVHQAVFPNWVHVVSVVRNRCAHHSRLWNWQLGITARTLTYVPNWNRQVLRHRNRTFFFLLLLKKLLSATGDAHVDAWRDAVTGLFRPILSGARYQAEMGAHEGWEADPLWI